VNKDHTGGDISLAHPQYVDSPMACGAMCETFPDCVAWSFRSTDSICYVKTTIEPVQSIPNIYTGTCKRGV
jgi:hypothetical protein